MPNLQIVCATIRESQITKNFEEKPLVLLRLKSFLLLAVLIPTGLTSVFAQETSTAKTQKKEKQTGKTQTADASKNAGKGASENATAEQVAESTILVYGNFAGRKNLNQIRKTTIERGKVSIVNAEGKTEQANYERFVLRADNLEKERIRLNQEFPNSRYALVYSDNKIFGLYNDTVFAPREDASKAFENQIWHGLEALLRYKENESKLELVANEKISGIDLYVLNVTDKQNRKTRFYVSTKSLKVMMLEYTQDTTKYRRKFYDYNVAQGTLVPYRTVLWAND